MTIDSATLSPDLQRLLASAPEADAAITTESLRFESAGTALEGYLAAPADTAAPLPGVLVLHDWFGMVDHVKVRAEMLARLGYVALAGDIYGADVRPADGGEASSLAGGFYGDVGLFRERGLANLEALRSDPRVDPSRVVVMGFCFGGSGALEIARSGAEVAGVVAFHGGLGTAAPAEPGSITAPVLVLTGADDPVVPLSAVETFENEMRTAGVDDWQIVSYSGALHAFAVPGTNSPEHGAAFQETANRRAWQAMQAFLDEVFA